MGYSPRVTEMGMTEATEHTLLLLAALPVSACREAQPLARQTLLRIIPL